MKKFIKFIVMIIVVFILLYVVKFLMDSNREYVLTHLDTVDVQETNPLDNIIIPKEDNTEKNAVKTTDELVQDIKTLEESNYEMEPSKTVDEYFGYEYLGSDYKAFFEAFGTDTTQVTAQVAGSMVHLMPYSDFVDEQEFHYNQDGELVLFKNIGAGSGFVTKLYFDKGKLIYTESIDEGEILVDNDTSSGEISGEVSGEVSGESFVAPTFDIEEVLSRGAKFYEKYFNEYVA